MTISHIQNGHISLHSCNNILGQQETEMLHSISFSLTLKALRKWHCCIVVFQCNMFDTLGKKCCDIGTWHKNKLKKKGKRIKRKEMD